MILHIPQSPTRHPVGDFVKFLVMEEAPYGWESRYYKDQV
jgi:hypothetical protein